MLSEFVIKRSRWERGKGLGGGVFLNCSTKQQCCVGIFLSACGIPDAALCGLASDNRLRFSFLSRMTRELSPLYAVNDSHHLTDEQRETQLTELFAAKGIAVTFID